MKELALEFDGRGEVKGSVFTQKYFDGKWYIYEVTNRDFPETKKHYEVFKRDEKTANPPYILEDLVRYPTSTNFGISAWTASTFEKALEIIEKRGKEIEN